LRFREHWPKVNVFANIYIKYVIT